MSNVFFNRTIDKLVERNKSIRKERTCEIYELKAGVEGLLLHKITKVNVAKAMMRIVRIWSRFVSKVVKLGLC